MDLLVYIRGFIFLIPTLISLIAIVIILKRTNHWSAWLLLTGQGFALISTIFYQFILPSMANISGNGFLDKYEIYTVIGLFNGIANVLYAIGFLFLALRLIKKPVRSRSDLIDSF